MVLDQVAQRAGGVVVARARADADVLGGRDLHVVDVGAVPERLEQRVREAQHQQVLDGLLAQVVVDAEDLLLAEDREHLAVQLQGGVQVGAERLLDDDPDLCALALVEPLLAQHARDHGEERGRSRQVEQPVERDPGLLVELVEQPAELVVAVRVVERLADVAHPPEQRVEHLLVGRAARELEDRLARQLAEAVVADVRARDADQVEPLGQRPLVREVVDRRQQLALRQVARRPEDDQRRRVDRKPLEPLGEGVRLGALLLLDRGHRASRQVAFSRSTAWPPNWLRRAAFTLAA